MSRLNLTLSADTFSKLARGARSRRVRVATYTRRLIEDALARTERAAHLKKLAADYAAGRDDAAELLADMEAGQLDLMKDD
jgi:hypothetical protein